MTRMFRIVYLAAGAGAPGMLFGFATSSLPSANTILARFATGAVRHQQRYVRSSNVPWGISESAYNVRDVDLTYQYSNFGVSGLGLKRGLSEDLVVAPYATGLAAIETASKSATRCVPL